MVLSFLTAADAAAIDTAIKQGAATRQLLTGLTTTFVRINEDTGVSSNIATNVALISITLANRDTSQTGTAQGATEIRSMGAFEIWAPAAIKIGDQFSWNGALCVVTRVAPAVHGIIAGAFELEKGVNP